MKRVALAAVFAFGCAAAAVTEAPKLGPKYQPKQRVVPPRVELFFRGEDVFARRGADEWPIEGVKKSEMVFSPDRQTFAYVRVKAAGAASPQASSRVVVRNLAGDPINEFAVYKPGRPEELIWVDRHRLGYKIGNLYAMHDVQTGEVLAARTGRQFTWDPGQKHLAFVTGAGHKQQVVVDGVTVWPRSGTTKVNGELVWSADGHGLAFTDETQKGPRLVVLVEYDDENGDLTWPLPREAVAPGFKVFWAGGSKVVIGETALRPRFAADWKRLN